MESKDVMPSLSKRRFSALRLANFRRTISSSIGLCLILCIFSGCSTLHPHTGSDIPPSTQEAMKALYIGMTETEALLVMKPVAMDVARITYGDTGRGQLYLSHAAVLGSDWPRTGIHHRATWKSRTQTQMDTRFKAQRIV